MHVNISLLSQSRIFMNKLVIIIGETGKLSRGKRLNLSKINPKPHPRRGENRIEGVQKNQRMV
jgi:hypothetical protein